MGTLRPGHHRRSSSISKYSPLQMSIMQLAPGPDQPASRRSENQGSSFAPTSDLVMVEGSRDVALVGDNHSASQKKPKASHQQQEPSSGQGHVLDQSQAQQGASGQPWPATAGRAESRHKPQPSFTYSPLMAQAPTESLTFSPASLAPVLEAPESVPKVPTFEMQQKSADAASADHGTDGAQLPKPVAAHHATQSSIYAPLGKARHSRNPSWTHAPLTQVSDAALRSQSGSSNSQADPAGRALPQANHPTRGASPAPQAAGTSEAQQPAGSQLEVPSADVASDSLAVQSQSIKSPQPELQRTIRHHHAPSSVYGPLGKAVRSSRILAEDSPRRHFDAAILGSLEDPFPRRQGPTSSEDGPASSNLSQPLKQPQSLQGQDGASQTQGSVQAAGRPDHKARQSDSQANSLADGPHLGYAIDHQAGLAQGGASAATAQQQQQQIAAGQGHQILGSTAHCIQAVPSIPPEAQQVGSEHWWAGSVMSDAMLSPLGQGAVQLSASQSWPTGSVCWPMRRCSLLPSPTVHPHKVPKHATALGKAQTESR